MAYDTLPLTPGASGRAVTFLQQRLQVTVTGVYDAATRAAVLAAQRRCALVADGVYGPATNNALTGHTAAAIAAAATSIGVPAAALQALIAVEASGDGFYDNGLPVIRLERHYVARLVTPQQAAQLSPAVCSSVRGGYVGGVGEWDRFDQVARVSLNVAIQACSWGLGQVMGANWQAMRYVSPQSLMYVAALDENRQITLMVAFLNTSPTLVAAMNRCDWTTVARLYNGPAYADNAYDTKLASAYSAALAIG